MTVQVPDEAIVVEVVPEPPGCTLRVPDPIHAGE
jgi:hypothetical protein